MTVLAVIALVIMLLLWHSLATISTPSAGALSLSADGSLSLRSSDCGDWRESALTSAFVSSWLIVLRLKGTRYPVVLFPDSVSADDCRRLRVFIQLHISSG